MGMIEINGVEFPVRALKRREVKALKKKGFTIGAITGALVDDAMDEVFALVLTSDQIEMIDGFDNPDAIKMWNAILRLTWGGDAETKNS